MAKARRSRPSMALPAALLIVAFLRPAHATITGPSTSAVQIYVVVSELAGQIAKAKEEAEAQRAAFDYMTRHAFDDLAWAAPWNPKDFYSQWLNYYGLVPGPIGPQTSDIHLRLNGERLHDIALPGLTLTYDLSARAIGQRIHRVGDQPSNFFADDAGSGWVFDGGVPP
jgi:hypothetical protein